MHRGTFCTGLGGGGWQLQTSNSCRPPNASHMWYVTVGTILRAHYTARARQMCRQDGMKRFSSVHVRHAGNSPIIMLRHTNKKLQHIKAAYDTFHPVENHLIIQLLWLYISNISWPNTYSQESSKLKPMSNHIFNYEPILHIPLDIQPWSKPSYPQLQNHDIYNQWSTTSWATELSCFQPLKEPITSTASELPLFRQS